MTSEAGRPEWNWNAIAIAAAFCSLAMIAALWAYRFDSALLDAFTTEDGPAENASAIVYVIASMVLAFALVRRRAFNVWILLLALLFFLVAGEEISWGQRIVGAETPDALKSANVQGELNLHNIEGIHQHVRALSVALLLSLYVLLPAGYAFSALRSPIVRLRMPVAPPWIGVIALFAVGFMAGPRAAGHVIFTLDEVGELLFAVAAICFAFSVARGAAGRTALPHSPD